VQWLQDGAKADEIETKCKSQWLWMLVAMGIRSMIDEVEL